MGEESRRVGVPFLFGEGTGLAGGGLLAHLIKKGNFQAGMAGNFPFL
jgi:hypothetical protein